MEDFMKKTLPLVLALSFVLVACGGSSDSPVTPSPAGNAPVTLAGGGVIRTQPLSTATLDQTTLTTFSTRLNTQLQGVLKSLATRSGYGYAQTSPAVIGSGLGALGLNRQAKDCTSSPQSGGIDNDNDGYRTYTEQLDCTGLFNNFPYTYVGTFHSTDKNDADPKSGYSQDGNILLKVNGALTGKPSDVFVSGIVNVVATATFLMDVDTTAAGGLTATYISDQTEKGLAVKNSVSQNFDAQWLGQTNISSVPDADQHGYTYTVNGSYSATGQYAGQVGSAAGAASVSGTIHYSDACTTAGSIYYGPDSGTLTYTSGGVTETYTFNSCQQGGG
jgi:hypothetical protein